ncbi:MAG: hypothetical protein V5A28_08200 [Haloarculaceae archaeon]
MDNRMTPVVVFVYTLAVLVTGLWVSDPTWPALNPVQVGMVAVLGLLWTVYFDRVMVPRIIDLETEDDEEETGERADKQSPTETEQAG